MLVKKISALDAKTLSKACTIARCLISAYGLGDLAQPHLNNVPHFYIINVIRRAFSTSSMRWAGIFPIRLGCLVTASRNLE